MVRIVCALAVTLLLPSASFAIESAPDQSKCATAAHAQDWLTVDTACLAAASEYAEFASDATTREETIGYTLLRSQDLLWTATADHYLGKSAVAKERAVVARDLAKIVLDDPGKNYTDEANQIIDSAQLIIDSE